MQAFVYRLNEHNDDLGTGRVSPYYVHFGNFMRHWATRYLPPGTYRAYIYNDWSRRYQEPDAVKVLTILPRP